MRKLEGVFWTADAIRHKPVRNYEDTLPLTKPYCLAIKACGYQQLGYGTKNRLTGKWTLDSNGAVLVFKKTGNL